MTIEQNYDILACIDAGYNAKVFKVTDAQGRLCAIKRLRTKEDCRRTSDYLFDEFSKEIEIFQHLQGVKGVPQLYDFHLGASTPLEENYLVMSWVDGKMASEKWGRHYDLDIITPEKLAQVYDILLALDKKGILHNDLWSTNILFGDNEVNIVDFNLGTKVNPLILYEKKHKDYYSNLSNFNRLFMDNFFADLYCEKGRDEFKKFYTYIAKCEYAFYKKKAVFMLSHNEPTHADYLFARALEIKKTLCHPKTPSPLGPESGVRGKNKETRARSTRPPPSAPKARPLGGRLKIKKERQLEMQARL